MQRALGCSFSLLAAVRADMLKHLYRLFCALCAVCLLAACATSSKPTALKDSQANIISGRISLLVQSEVVQSFAGSFELQGDSTTGTLSLLSPLGSTVAVLRWAPGLAQLDNAGNTTNYPSVASMMQQTTGAAVPMDALFAWLRGDNPTVAGWQADVSRHAQGRINAQRTDPLPSAQLRIVLDTAP
jgi:outer membrane lipoprotein LolB